MSGENIALAAGVGSAIKVEERKLYSEFLEREVVVDIFSPVHSGKTEEIDLLLVNDGQDLKMMHFAGILDPLIAEGSINSIVVVGIHCGIDRMNEYGTAYRADYKGRGAKAGLYTKFILTELLPFLHSEFGFRIKQKSFAGFSLGGLSALDIVWNHPQEFSHAGVFSGALWWRRHDYEDLEYDAGKDRIMHLQVQKGQYSSGLKFFFQCGCRDETADRNNNGVIDSIEDTLDLVEDLKALGYKNDQLHYLQLEDGEHNISTWASAFPAFLTWGWGR
jgi:enterochelin esterase-like enzyme